jgi:hypothetical protein
MKNTVNIIIVIVCLLATYSCIEKNSYHNITINSSRDTTIILTRPNYTFSSDAGGEFIGGAFIIKSISGYADAKTTFSMYDVHKNRQFCMYNYVFDIDSGKINKNELWWDFYAGKVMIKFRHEKAKKGKYILNIKF